MPWSLRLRRMLHAAAPATNRQTGRMKPTHHAATPAMWATKTLARTFLFMGTSCQGLFEVGDLTGVFLGVSQFTKRWPWGLTPAHCGYIRSGFRRCSNPRTSPRPRDTDRCGRSNPSHIYKCIPGQAPRCGNKPARKKHCTERSPRSRRPERAGHSKDWQW